MTVFFDDVWHKGNKTGLHRPQAHTCMQGLPRMGDDPNAPQATRPGDGVAMQQQKKWGYNAQLLAI